MALYSLNDERYPLPKVINPPDSICYVVQVPNDPGHIQAFLGALYDLSQWINWQRDGTTRAAQTARVWKKIWLALEPQACDQITTISQIGTDEGVELMIRQNPDNPCILESSIDGTHWCQFADLSLCMNFGSQPGPGSPQPPPGGGTAQSCATLWAAGKYLIPINVNTGDQITLDSAGGAGNDGGSVSWFCADGSFFFDGKCAGGGGTDSGDPVPTAKHMKIILGIDPNFYEISIGVPFTVPSGFVNAQPFLQVNDSELANNSGSYNVCVTVKNNAATSWCHDLDFTLNTYGFANFDAGAGGGGTWIPGVGFTGTFGTDGASDYMDVKISIASASIDTIRVVYSVPGQVSGGGGNWTFSSTNGGLHHVDLPHTEGAHDFSDDYATDSQTLLEVDLQTAAASGHATLTRLVISGHGPDPFMGAPTC